ncbi:diacylglycerol/lipid kinase family protein [Flavihumibacter sp.]|uniref:diacylglycerol/lipid kinase family protein n=1 Tax=Flavihumibacter sp. TaxID=1913981 RepID=UPI002FC5C827|nr:hypothetical protein [Flavihumibacter sediminis]
MIAILLNPYAGRRKSKSILATIEKILINKEVPYSAFINSWPQNYSEYSQIWLIGGDGTLNFFVNNYDCKNIPLALFKGGTGNDFAWKLYGGCSTSEQVLKVLGAVPRALDAGICNGKYFLNTLGIGFDGRVLSMMQTIRWLGSSIGYYLAIIRIILLFQEPVYSITKNGGKPVFGKLLLLLLSNSSRTGGGFLVSPMAEPDDGVLDLITCEPLNITHRLWVLPLVRTGKHISLPFVKHEQLKELVVQTDILQPAQLDGELIIASRFDCSIAKGKFLFLY